MDDIRNAKGLALLERTEAESEVSRLELAAKRLAERLKSFVAVYESNPVAVLANENGPDLYAEAIKLAREIEVVKARFTVANAKCKEFGI
ncbi:MAG: hypothetical protein ACRD22_08575 [Terriglobia bacterium]